MAVDASVQALVATFAFGIVVNAASAGFFLHVRGHGSTIFRDGLRLVLITFFACAALWAQISFIAALIDQSATSSCQVALIFTTAFDQLARVAVEQYLLWAISQQEETGKRTIGQMVPQALLIGRLIVGGIFVGFTKPEFSPVCAPSSSVVLIAILAIAFDAIMIAVLGVRLFSTGMYDQMRAKTENAPRGKAVLFSILGLAVWTASSVPMLLGMGDMDLILRTAVPAVGLVILLAIVAASAGNVVVARSRPSGYPEAPSPRQISSSRDISTSDSEYPPTNYEDVKGGMVRTRMSSFNMPREPPKAEDAPPLPGMGGVNGFGGANVRGNLFPPARSESLSRSDSKSQSKRRGVGGKIAISNPVLQQGSDENNPLRKIATIDLASAALAEKERREEARQNMQREPEFTTTRSAPQPPIMTSEEAMLQRGKSIRRKVVASTGSQDISEFDTFQNDAAATTSAELSPSMAGDELRRRSPRQAPEAVQMEAARPRTPPRSPLRLIHKDPSPPRPPRPESLNIGAIAASNVASNKIMTSLPSPKTPRRAPPRPASPAKSAKFSPGSSISSPPRPAAQALRNVPAAPSPPKAPSPPREVVQPAAESKPLERKITPPKRMTRGAAFPIMPVSRKQSPPPEVAPQSAVEAPIPAAQEEVTTTALDRSGSGRSQGGTNIRPSRKYTDPDMSKGEPLKTPLQRRLTSGLPGNPRARTMKAIAADASVQREQTVMFINTIQYNDPTGVQNIIDGASKGKDFPQSARSVVHRPRPIPRKPEEDVAFFPPIPSPHGHRRTKSGGSITSRKSILQSNPGSPTALPPLPPPPMNPPRGNIRPDRPLPNDTKSMTFDEKMTLLFPAPPSGGNAGSRQSPVPEMPQIPATYYEVATSPVDSTASDGEHLMNRQSKRQSRRSTKISLRTADLIGSEDVTEINRRLPQRGDMSDPVGSWLPSEAPDLRFSVHPSYDGSKRKSSPVIPPRMSVMTDDDATNWGSVHVHSPAEAVTIQNTRINPRTTYIKQDADTRVPSIPSDLGRENGEVMTFKLDVESLQSAQINRTSWYVDQDVDMGRGNREGQWHHRPGDECPTFSARKEKTKSRKMVPPTPLLLLNAIGNNKAVVVQEAEPSPIESPSDTLATIQNQLKTFEQPNRGSTGSRDGQRMTLLQNLEQEMGQLDNKWAVMQTQLGRDSMSTVDSRRESLAVPQTKASVIAERRASRRSQLLNGNVPKSTWSVASSVTSDNTRASIWQARVAEAQAEYMDNAPELLEKRNINYLAISKAQLGSPTPPDSEDEEEMIEETIVARPRQDFPMTWYPASPIPAMSIASALWNAPTKRRCLTPEHIELPGLNVRPAIRKTAEPLEIESWSLWQASNSPQQENHPIALWGACPKQRAAAAKNRTAQRPPRMSRRVTLLPDILESPEPLPDNAANLGIFQFPWGEKSDTATIQPRASTMYRAMPGTMTTGGPLINAALEARSKQIESEEYSLSVFDDYEEDAEPDSDSDAPSGDDDFDETTIWEIASLLQSNAASKDSTIPHGDLVDSYMDGTSSDEDAGESSFFDEDEDASIIAPLKMRQPAMKAEVAPLWDGKPKSKPTAETGLPQPSDWRRSYVSENNDTVRPPTRHAEPATIESTDLWAPGSKNTQDRGMDLWAEPKTETASKPAARKMPGSKGPKSGMMWASKAQEIKANKGLPQPDHKAWSAYQTTGKATRAPPRKSELEPVESSSLWKSGAGKTRESKFGALWATSKPEHAQAAVVQRIAVVAPMWAGKATKVNAVSKGLPQPANWESSQSSIPRVRSPPRESDFKPVESTDLWAQSSAKTVSFQREALWAAEPVSKPTPQMWTKPAMKAKANKGLPQPDEEVWDVYQPSSDRSRSPPRQEEFDMTITSTALWQSGSSDANQASTSALWGSSSSPKSARTPRVVLSTLWELPSPTSERSVSPDGMFQASSSRTDYRSTTEEPATMSPARKARSSDDAKPLDQLTSNNLWTSLAAKEVSPHWMSASSRSVSVKPVRQQWRRPVAFRADWEAALAEAVSRSVSTFVRHEATAADWAAALAEAVDASALNQDVPRAVERIAAPGIAAQIEALEREKEFAARFATRSIYVQQPEIYVDAPVGTPVQINAAVPTITAFSPEPEPLVPVVEATQIGESRLLSPNPVQNSKRSSFQSREDQAAAERMELEMQIAAQIMAQANMVYAEPSPIWAPQ